MTVSNVEAEWRALKELDAHAHAVPTPLPSPLPLTRSVTTLRLPGAASTATVPRLPGWVLTMWNELQAEETTTRAAGGGVTICKRVRDDDALAPLSESAASNSQTKRRRPWSVEQLSDAEHALEGLTLMTPSCNTLGTWLPQISCSTTFGAWLPQIDLHALAGTPSCRPPAASRRNGRQQRNRHRPSRGWGISVAQLEEMFTGLQPREASPQAF